MTTLLAMAASSNWFSGSEAGYVAAKEGWKQGRRVRWIYWRREAKNFLLAHERREDPDTRDDTNYILISSSWASNSPSPREALSLQDKLLLA
jgi:hypothetical protein